MKARAHGGVAKSWAQRVRIHGRATNLGLGSYSVVSLAKARARALENARAVAQGRDPRTSGVPKFEVAAERVIALHGGSWKASSKTERQWRASFERHVYPRIGGKRVDQVTGADVLGVLEPLSLSKAETARKLRFRLGLVFKWAVSQGIRSDNPAGESIAGVLPRNGVSATHHRALAHGDVAAALAQVSRAALWWSIVGSGRVVFREE